eukprot:TRINITY_DN17361_c0_g1_i1.p1 TRINITY_DN17361_c0_g1~~TRINITY_DN17361_c0_g1_i1.p1  ORF type:complete len:169 (-),score=32.01 TRINITY_DN17361_c0_g1_i1:61-540(-)
MALSFSLQYLLAVLVSIVSASSCPHGWYDGTSEGLGCVLFNGDSAYTWNSAQEYCHTEEESNLVEVFTPEQQEFLTEMAYQIEMFSGVARDWWIGATDVASEGQWIWPHQPKAAEYTARHGGEPNNGATYNYAYMENSYEYQWADAQDTSSMYPICQKV